MFGYQGVLRMANLYHVLQVDEQASPAVLTAAYQALRAEAVGRGDQVRIGELDAAYAILGNTVERARYDESQPADADPAVTADGDSDSAAAVAIPPTIATGNDEDPSLAAEPVSRLDDDGEKVPDESPGAGAYAAYQVEQDREPSPAAGRRGSKGLILALAGMVLVLMVLIGGGLWYLLTQTGDDDGGEYTTDFDDNAGDVVEFLAAMALRPEDVPEGIEILGEATFTNQEWAEVVDEEDPEAKVRQLDAQGRVRNFLSLFQNPAVEAGSFAAFGRPFTFTSQSSIFRDEEMASQSLRETCDVELQDSDQPSSLEVPKIGDESSGFEVRTVVDDFGGEIVDTVVCFRTGRIVHSVSQRGVEGTEDLQLSVDLARKMLEHVESAFDGERRDPELQGG